MRKNGENLTVDEVNIQDISLVETNVGISVKARYLNIAGYDLCLQLHKVFLFYSKDRCTSSAYLLNQAIEIFFIFIKNFNDKQSNKLKVDSLSQVNSEVFRAYI